MNNEFNGVYLITNTVNNRIYVGSAAGKGGFAARWRGWYNKYLKASFKKYGRSKFRFEILEVCRPIYCLAYEQVYLDLLQPWFETGKGYNFEKKAGSRRLGKTCSKATAEKIRQSNIGRKDSAETKARKKALQSSPERRELSRLGTKRLWQNPKYRDTVSSKNATRWQDPVIRKRIIDAQNYAWDNPERRLAASEKATANQASIEARSKRSKQIESIDPDTGVITEYYSLREAARNKFRPDNIRASILSGQLYRNLFWQLKNDF